MHLHLRDEEALKFTVPQSYRCFARAVIMPNLNPPIDSIKHLLAYRKRILAHIPKSVSFLPLMTIYLHENLKTQIIADAFKQNILHAVKLYPHGTTTQSQSGLKRVEQLYHFSELLQKLNIPLLIHAEDPNPNLDIFDREKSFIDNFANTLAIKFPKLRLVIEHVSSKHGVDFVKSCPNNVAATITPQHLLYTRNALFTNGLRPHYYCLPILKTENDRKAIQEQVLMGNPKFFLGTDSAPHSRKFKEMDCGCAGIFSSPVALESYADFFDQHGKIELLANFSSKFGADFYGLSYNNEIIHLQKKPHIIPNEIPYVNENIVPFRANKNCQWQLLVK